MTEPRRIAITHQQAEYEESIRSQRRYHAPEPAPKVEPPKAAPSKTPPAPPLRPSVGVGGRPTAPPPVAKIPEGARLISAEDWTRISRMIETLPDPEEKR